MRFRGSSMAPPERSDDYGYHQYTPIVSDAEAAVMGGQSTQKAPVLPAEFISTKRVGAIAFTKDGVPGMQITYAHGYVSWCPMDVFKRDYEPITAMSYGHALFAMERGAKVARTGWNGKGMWLVLVKDWTGNFGGDLPVTWSVAPFVAMKTATDQIVPWLCSHTDALAHDWMVIL